MIRQLKLLNLVFKRNKQNLLGQRPGVREYLRYFLDMSLFLCVRPQKSSLSENLLVKI
jgi:hypothetical protein